jgi:5-methylcytosine-specific restriction endonuclease McrA
VGELAQRRAALAGRRNDLPKQRTLAPQEQKALQAIRREAKSAGSALASGGEGGLPPSLVLGVMRRDKFTCKVCGELGNKANGGISIHHKGGVENPNSPRLEAMGKENKPENLVTLCVNCHDGIHERDRARGEHA